MATEERKIPASAAVVAGAASQQGKNAETKRQVEAAIDDQNRGRGRERR
jgi:hypothetical protein